MRNKNYDFIIVGGGIIGASAAYKLKVNFPKSKILVIEKEVQSSAHQTGRNSGVIHSGLYYSTKSLKAMLCVSGNENLQADYCGIRPKIYKKNQSVPDFYISSSDQHGMKGLYNLQGIESPGLTSSLSIGQKMYDLIKRDIK